MVAVQRSVQGDAYNVLSAGPAAYYGNGQYTYTDNRPADNNLYRIKSMDKTGVYHYSPVIRLSKKQKDLLHAVITNNGISDDNILQVTDCAAGTLQISVYNMQGVQMLQVKQPADGGNFQYRLPAGLPQGIYLVRLSCGPGTATLRWQVL